MTLLGSAPDSKRLADARVLLQTALNYALSLDEQRWLSDRLAQVGMEQSNFSIDLAFGLCSHHLSTNPFILNTSQVAKLAELIPGWELQRTNVDAIARILLISCFKDPDKLAIQVERLLRRAESREKLAIYKGFPLYPPSDTLNDCLALGLNTQMHEVFMSIAHANPYPALHLDTARFNQMILKALSMQISLSPIVGLRERNNPALVESLLDIARDKHAVYRSVSDELWDLAKQFMSESERREFNLLDAESCG